MSFLDDIAGGAGSVLSNFASNLATTALLGFTLNQLNKSVSNNPATPTTTTTYVPDAQTRLQNNASPENAIPIVYGQATLGGIVTDAALSADQLTMYFCLTLSEQTGNVNLGSGAKSQISFYNLYFNDNKMVFEADGITLKHLQDRDGNIDATYAGLIQVWCYSGNSTSPTNIYGYSSGASQPAYNIFPNWTSTNAMNDLVFAIVKVKYNTEKGLTSLGSLRFTLKNSMKQPGDCMYDYLTNTRYGAGLNPSEIYSS